MEKINHADQSNTIVSSELDGRQKIGRFRILHNLNHVRFYDFDCDDTLFWIRARIKQACCSNGVREQYHMIFIQTTRRRIPVFLLVVNLSSTFHYISLKSVAEAWSLGCVFIVCKTNMHRS